jgi:UDP-glucuronate 4-epimerase
VAVLVTGAAGFIGSHVVDHLLARGEEVVGLDSFDDFYRRPIKEANLTRARDHGGFRLVESDIRDRAHIESLPLPDSVEAVIHLAARAGVRPSIRDPFTYAEVNVLGTQVVLDLVRQRGIPTFVFGSSSSVYGNNEKVPFSEDDRVEAPISPYAATKRSGELLCYAQTHLFGTACVCLRFFTAYGPRQRPDLAIRKFSGMLLRGEALPRFGDGSTARDYTYVDDIVAGVDGALGFAAKNPGRFEIVNLGESATVTLSEMIDTVGEVFGREPQVNELPAEPGDVQRTCADVGKARALLGYRPTTAFREGMGRFAAWYLSEGARQDGAV